MAYPSMDGNLHRVQGWGVPVVKEGLYRAIIRKKPGFGTPWVPHVEYYKPLGYGGWHLDLVHPPTSKARAVTDAKYNHERYSSEGWEWGVMRVG